MKDIRWSEMTNQKGMAMECHLDEAPPNVSHQPFKKFCTLDGWVGCKNA